MVDFKQNNLLINKEVNQYLESIIKKKLFANGYIFFGEEGLGKRQTALHFIEAIFKEYSSSKKIKEKIFNNNHPDLLVIEPESFIKVKTTKTTDSEIKKKNNSSILKIEQIRNVKIFLGQKPIESQKKIVLIVDAHLLNEAASNCLLKTLEEPSNGIFILITSQLNLLLDTIKSRCQLIRFKSFSSKQIEIFFKEKLDSSEFKINKKLNFQDLINASNGSPGKVLDSIEIWNELSNEIIEKLNFPLKDSLEILKVSKLISEQLENHQQIHLIHLIQQIWWRKTRNAYLVKKLESLKLNIKNNIQPRLAWEVTLLKIAMEDFKF